MEHDAVNRVTKLTDEGGNERRDSYNILGDTSAYGSFMIQRDLPTGRSEKYYYDKRVEAVLSVIEAAGSDTGFGYTHDGFLDYASNEVLTVEHKYDILQQLKKQIYTKLTAEEFQHMYDKTGKLMLVESGTGQDMTAVEYAYNKQGRPYRIARYSGPNQLTAGIFIEYDKAGRKTKVGYGNMMMVAKYISYYPTGKVREERLEAMGEVKYKALYEYNKNGFMTKKTESMNPARRGDPRGRPQ
ncbi:MAG: hypothetical protein PHQ23_04030 [Candidatus Wallbacteria bacterium]|nr:hypothetical protein [Candidatus Wallbacteria bacterium]